MKSHYYIMLSELLVFLSGFSERCILSFAWSEPITLSAPWQIANEHQLGVSKNNNAIAAWHRFDGDYERIQTSLWDGSTGNWSDVVTISPGNRNSEYPAVDIDSEGNAFVVWRWFSGTNWIVRASRYNALSKNWQTPISSSFLSPGGYDSDVPQVAMSDNKTAVAVWQFYYNPWIIMANVYSGTNWSGTVNILSPISSPWKDASQPVIAMDSLGNGIAAWYQFDGSCWRILTHRYIQGFGWQGSVSIHSSAGFNAYNPEIAMDAQGNAIMVWQLADGTGKWSIQAAYYKVGTGWFSSVNLATNVDVGSSSHQPFVHIAANDSGKAFVEWYETVAGQQYVKAKAFSGTWPNWATTSTLSQGIDPVNAFDNPAPRIAIDNNGNGIATWTIYDSEGKRRVQASYYNGTIWLNLASVPILSQPHQSAHEPQVGMDSSGNGLIVWQRSDGTNVVTYANGNKRIQAAYYKTNL